MSNYIILSEKEWNKRLVIQLNAKSSNDKFILIDSKEDFTVERLKEILPVQIFIPHWSHYIPEDIFMNFECIVFHMTDLPYGRGGSPLQNLISKGFSETKISALKVIKELDAGPIYIKKTLSLMGTAEEIFIRANLAVENMILEIIDRNIFPKEQVGIPTTFKRRTPNMSDIKEISELTQLFDHIRMLDAEGYPNAFLENEHFRFEFTRASLKADETILADVRIIKK